MAEEIKTTSAGDSVPDKSVVGSASQDEEWGKRGAEEGETGADGAIVPDEKMVDENEIDAKPANMSDDGKVKKEVEGKTAASVESEKGEVAEEEDKGESESQAEEKEGIDAKKEDEEDLSAEGKSEVPSAKETQAGMSLNEDEADDKEKNGKEEGEEAIEEKAEEKVGGEVEEKAEEGTEEEAEEKAAEEKEEENVEGKAEEGLSGGEATNQSESEEKEVAAEGDEEKKESAEEETVKESKETKAGSEDAGKENLREREEEKAGEGDAEENSEIKTEENLAKEGEEAVVGVEPSLFSSEEIGDEDGNGVTDGEWISWKSEFVNKFNKRFDRKWIIYGIGIVVLIVGFVIFFNVPGLRSPDGGEVKSPKEIAGPVYDMKFFLPLDTSSRKTRFIKLSVAIELMDRGFRKEIDKKISDLREEVINLVLTKSPKEVISSHGKEMLKKAITKSINKHFSNNCIRNTYFTELVIL